MSKQQVLSAVPAVTSLGQGLPSHSEELTEAPPCRVLLRWLHLLAAQIKHQSSVPGGEGLLKTVLFFFSFLFVIYVIKKGHNVQEEQM